MKKHTKPLACGVFYHIYNRGINGEDIFKEERNYAFFLQKYARYIQPVAETYAYCLLKNHFHILIKTRTAEEVMRNMRSISDAGENRNVGAVPNLADVLNPSDVPNLADVTETTAVKHISNQFAKLFNSYAQAINKAYHRTGGLFENVFRRIPVTDAHYFVQLVYYIHANPQRHGFVSDFKDYPHSSYHTHLSNLQTKMNRNELLHWFGSSADFEQYHLANHILANLDKFEIEVD
jgi:REP element-mobilizing transposase RayT